MIVAELYPETIKIDSVADIVAARQVGRNMSRQLGFGTIMQSRMATTISELARNIFLYAGEGTITITPIEREGAIGLQITALDAGPGIADIRKVLEDGYSTSGALGAGLPGVRRMMDEFDIQSALGEGTKVIVVKWRS
ncbi:anti-sigma regulatory factor [Brevibacillus centrosporus]|uniref:Anti-sigma regulatory factor n=1 Tax=Brevibacillus nitrificans TaxID=651560 RepID=A0A3M8D079_9BACL|nr:MULTISPECIES: anti-sigma regulatory factor [Brevibacillus]MEC2128678.1 anti-sigma regulatory factor [Brevibacillus centrosporus]MED1796810.1 anti-sigma regulatory factor [Brevibacillus nitrificans]MED1953200.1 anti-sigma regulatory factor [Brevibacillus centrosporus]MED4910317.1 anti-sigma regulatory factor [Brevibacillus centrosporus]RNB71452.1 anti-sigma regulatory factor [Brevibacillus centrosporus]